MNSPFEPAPNCKECGSQLYDPWTNDLCSACRYAGRPPKEQPVMYKVVVKNTAKYLSMVTDVIPQKTLELTCEALADLYVDRPSKEGTSIEVFDGQRSVAVLDPGAANWVIRDPAEQVVDPDVEDLWKDIAPGYTVGVDPAAANAASGVVSVTEKFDPVAALDEMVVLAFAPGQRRKEPPVEKMNVSEIFMESTAREILSSDQKRPRPGSEPPPSWMWSNQPMEFVSPVPEPPLEQRPMKLGNRLLGGRKPRKFNFGEA